MVVGLQLVGIPEEEGTAVAAVRGSPEEEGNLAGQGSLAVAKDRGTTLSVETEAKISSSGCVKIDTEDQRSVFNGCYF